MFNVISGHTNFTHCTWEYTDTGITIIADSGYYLIYGLKNLYLNDFDNSISAYPNAKITLICENDDRSKLTEIQYTLDDNTCYFFRFDVTAYTMEQLNGGTQTSLTTLGNRLQNCTYTISSVSATTLAVTITADTGYRFTGISGLDDYYNQRNGVGYRTSGQYLTPISFNDNIDLTSTTLRFRASITASAGGFYLLHDIVAYPSGGLTILRLPQGTLFNGDMNITPLKPITAVQDFKIMLYDGYSVNTPQPYFRKYYQDGLISDGLVYFTKNDDNTTLTYTIPSADLAYYSYFINFNLIEIVEIPRYTLSNMLRIYVPTNEELNGISLLTSSRYIMNLYVLPFNVTENISTEKVAIVLGTESSTQTATQVLKWVLTVDGGTINIPSEYGNVYDYKDVELTIYIPFIGYNQLPTYLIGSYVRVSYNVNLYEGTTTTYVTKGDDVILAEQKKVGYYLPFYSGFDDSTVSSISLPMVETHDQCFIKVVRKIPYPDSGVFGKVNSYYGLVSAETGYFEVDDIQLSDTIPQEMQSEIVDIMKRGVFI